MLNGTRNIMSKRRYSYPRWLHRETNNRIWLLLPFIKIINHNLYVFSRHQVLFFSFNFSCCKAHDFCERNLVKPEKCGGNLNYIDQRFEYDAATDTCSKYYQFFLYIISSLSFFSLCVSYCQKSLASTFLHSPIHTEIYTVKNYCACLWLDERCIFTVVRFQSFKCVGQWEKISVCIK